MTECKNRSLQAVRFSDQIIFSLPEDGTGLLNDISEDISGSGAKGKAKELLVELKSYCYHINENERSARIGELSALIFMQKVGSKDPKIQQEIATSVKKYKKYQQFLEKYCFFI